MDDKSTPFAEVTTYLGSTGKKISERILGKKKGNTTELINNFRI